MLDRVGTELPPEAQALARAGLERLVDYQDAAYAGDNLDRLRPLLDLDRRHGGAAGHALTAQAAKYLAVAMSYDDVLRVADLETRASRFARVRREVTATSDQILYTTEFMHPRVEEVLSLLPRAWGERIEARPGFVKILDRWVNRRRRVRSGTIVPFLTLYGWPGCGAGGAAHFATLANATISRRGWTSSSRPSRATTISRSKPWRAAVWLRRLKEAALADESGTALDGALKTMRSAYG